ncbi:response regulator [Chitinophagaceae bacterium LWZ2-11]
MDSIRIAVIDDQKLFRQSLVSLIGTIPGCELVMEAENGKDCLEKLLRVGTPPNVALMDMEMPEMNGIELNENLHKYYPEIKVIVLSVHAKERLIAKMIEAGASGYLLKNCDKEELINCIYTVSKSGFYINSHTLKAIQNASAQKNKPIRNINDIPIELSVRENEVLQLICQEFSNAEIAERLYISVRTAEGHRNNLLSKTGCRNTAGLVLFAVRYNIFEIGI